MNLLTTAQVMQECAISELALRGESMTKTKVQLCDRNLSSVNDTMSQVQAWIIRTSPPEGTDTRVTELPVGRLPSLSTLADTESMASESAGLGWRYQCGFK